jgi:PAS domain S-box-containing protein
MTVSRRLALAMVLLIVMTSCAVSALAWYFIYYFPAEPAPRAALAAILGAGLAGGAVAAMCAIGLAAGTARDLLKLTEPPAKASEPAMACQGKEKELAYQTLVDSERMARSIIEGALDAFIQTDGCCVILNWSPHAEALMGWTHAEAVGRSAEELLFPESQRATHRMWVERFLREAAGGAIGGRYETPLLHRDGREFFAEVSLTALRRGEGYIVNAFVRDITEKRAAQEQLFQAQKMESVGQLTGGIAHDFNNMLTVITGTIEILADGVKHDPALASIAKMINDAADRASQLTANLLAFARKQPLRPLETDVNALIEEVVNLLAPTLGRQIEIDTALSDQAWPALVDRSQLTSALVNLAINARDAMPDGGRLLFRTGNFTRQAGDAEVDDLGVGDYVAIEVIDGGIGIPLAIRDRIFEPFFSTKQFGTGTGLGLSMVFGFAKQSGGNVVVDGEEGKGACFRIYLPKADVGPSDVCPASEAAPPEDDELRGGTETILCVEDDDVVRAHVTGRLESLGYKVITASNAAAALERVNAGAAFDLLFTDIIMPGAMNGRQLAQKVAELRRPLRVLYTSGNTFGAFDASVRFDDGVLLLTKPYRKAELARMVRLALDRAIDHMGDPIPLPYSVQEDLVRFLRENPPTPR